MAHERLRFPLVLNRDGKGNIENEFVFEPIYSDIIYGTHYGIYADFKGKVNSNSKLKYEVDAMEFRIQNYTGDITIGFSKVLGYRIKELEEGFGIEGFSTGRLIKIYMLLQGFNSKFYDTLPSQNQDKGKPSDELGLDLFQGDVIEVNVFYEPVDNKYSRINETPETRNDECLFADPLYLVRDGEEIGLLRNTQEKIKMIEIIKEKGLDEGLREAWSENLDTLSNDSVKRGDKEEMVFGAIGGGRACKMKLSDVYILE